MIVHLPIQAFAPDFGVRVIVEEEEQIVRVQALDNRGRGGALRAVVVPVEGGEPHPHNNARLRVKGFSDDDERLLIWQELEKAGVRRLEEDGDTKSHRPESPYFYKLSREEWPKHDPVLILLCYVQSASIGMTLPRAPISRQLRAFNRVRHAAADDEPALLTKIAAAIATVLARPACELRGGLVEGKRAPAHPPDADRIVFAMSSCHYPSDILGNMPDGDHDTRGPADASLLALGDLLGKVGSPSLLLLSGDQVYADATAGLFDPKILDDKLRIPYERRGASRGAQAVLQRLDLDVRMMMDDHEIQNNWEPDDPQDLSDSGKHYYFRFQQSLAVAPPLKTSRPVWFKLKHAGFRFFIGDTRTEREGRTALDYDKKKIMSDRQSRELYAWLGQHTDRPRFVLTPAALFPRRLAVSESATCALQSDAWDGYPSSHYELLSTLCEAEHKGVVFLSGDEHLSSFSQVEIARTDGSKRCQILSLHSSALYAPYSFANDTPASFSGTETFCFPDPKQGPYICSVKTTFAEPGDGFAIVKAEREKADWKAKVEFHGVQGLKPNGSHSVLLMA